MEDKNKKIPKVNRLAEFLEGKSKVVEIVLEREDKKDWTLLHFVDKETGAEIWQKWGRKGDLFGTKVKKDTENYGGVEPYVMFHPKRLKKVFKGDYVGNMQNQITALTFLSEYIQSNTGKLINKRTKKPLTRQEIAKDLGLSVRRTSEIISDLKTNGFLERRNNAYYVHRDFYAKGRSFKQCDTTSSTKK